MKTNLSEIGKAYFGSAIFFTIAGEGAMIAAANYQWVHQPDYLLPVLASFTLPALPLGFYLAGRVARLSRPPAAARPAYYGGPSMVKTLTSMAATIARQPKAPPGSFIFEGQGRNIRYRPDARKEFIFWEAGMESMITDIRLFGFCKIAWRRQQHTLYGNLGSNQIFSRLYFTREAKPRFPLPDYNSCMHILMSRGLILNRWQGKGGQLRYPAYSTVEEAKQLWDLPKSSS